MAGLLSWIGGLNSQKKKNELASTPLISSLRSMSVTPAKTNSTTNKTSIFSLFGASNNTQQRNDFARQQAEQQEEQQRQQRIAEVQRQQEQRRQQEQAKKLQEQQAQQQKQRNLLTSALQSTDLRANLQAQKQAQAQQQQQQAAKKKAEEEANPWKKYYEEEKQKVRDEAFNSDRFGSHLQDMFNAGWDSRLAETRARNRYNNELLNKAYDDDGNTRDEEALSKAKKSIDETTNVAKQYSEQEHAKGKAIGATADSDYYTGFDWDPSKNKARASNIFEALGSLGKQAYGTLNAVRSMDVGNAILQGAEGGAADAGKFLLNLLPGMASAPIQGAGNIMEAISGKGTDQRTGEHRELTGLERMGRGVSGAIDAAGVFFGGSGDLLKSVGNALFKKGATEATKQAVKQTTKEVIKGYLKAMLEEGAEEAVQQAFEFFGDGGTLVTSDGEFDADSFKQLLAESAQAGALGAVGGGIFHGGAQAMGKIQSNFNNRLIAKNAKTNTVLNTDTNVNENNNIVDNTNADVNENIVENTNEETNIDPSRVKTTKDGTMVKQNADGTASRLSDAELANVITNNSQTAKVAGTNPFETNSLNLRSSSEDIDTLTKRAAQGDTYAQQRLAEITGRNQDENTDWRGKSVDEVVNPETDENVLVTQNNENQETNQKQDQKSDWLDNEQFNKLTPTEQRAYLEQHSNAPAFWLRNLDSAQLAGVAREFGIDPAGMSMVDVMRAIQEKVRNPNVEVNTQEDIDNTPEIVASERDAYGEAADRVEIEEYYKKYGNDFYENMPEHLQDAYEQILDNQPRNENGVYADPITGEEVIDQAASPALPAPEELGIDTSKLAPQMFDEDGNPMVMYHGTPNGGFERFNDGSYFTPDKNYASRYLEPSASSMAKSGVQKATNPMMYDTYLDIRKPFDLNDKAARDIFINDYVKGGNATGINPYLSDAEYQAINNLDWTEVESLRDFLQENGYDYDAIIANEGGDLVDGKVVPRGQSFVPFSGDQVRIIPQNIAENTSAQMSEQARKNAQFDMLQKTNPMTDDYHTGIRSADDINSLNELVNNYDADSMFTYPDFTIEDAKRAVKNGVLSVYSSKPIEPGVFVSPSKMMATDYAGGNPNNVYSQEISINDFAAIESGDKGNYLPVSDNSSMRMPDSQTILSNKLDEVLNDRNYRQPVMLRETTPDALVKLGIKDLPMYENPSHIRNNIFTESEAKEAGIFRDQDHYHGLGKDVYMDAINGLEVPRAVFKKNNGSNDYLILTTARNKNGNTVIVPIEIESTTRANRIDIDTNRIKSVFGYNEDFGKTLDRYIKDNLKSNMFTKIEPGVWFTNTAGSDMNVSQNASKVNANDPLVQYYQKYGEGFYDKLPERLKNRYDDLLDMQPRDGNGRYVDPITGDTWIDAEVNTGRNYEIESESESLPEDFDVKHYVTDQVEAQQKRSKLPLRERIADATAELKHYLVDDAVAYERYIKDKNERLNLREGVDRVRSSDMIARQYMQDHGLGEIGKMSNAELNEFQQYLIAKRAQEVEAQGKKTGRSKAADQALIDSVGDKYAKQEAIIRQYTRDMLDYSAENGLISEKLKNKLIEENPNYVPMNRVFDVVEKKTGFKSKQLGNLNDQSVVQKMTGSERVVDNPIESLMSNTMRMINESERNNVAKLISQSEAFHEKVLKDGEKPRPGYDKLSYMIDGKTVSYEVPELVAREMKNLNNVLPKAADNILKVVGAPTRWLRSGATQNNPIFAASNLLRDQMQTLVTGNVTANLRGTKDAIVATFSPGKRGQELRAELNRAGIIGNEYRQTYGYKSGDLMAQLQADNNIKKGAVERIKHPMDALGDLIGRTEYFTRAQQYFGTNGDATTKAQAARNNTLNFGRAGATTRILNRIVPFLNAGVQGGRITVNSFKNRPVHTTLAMASLTAVALAAKGANEAQNKELWDRIDDSDKGQNIIIFTPDAHYNSETNRVEGIIKIPVAQMLYPLMDAANNLKGDASDATVLAGDIFTAVTGLEAPNEEQGLLPVVNQLTPTAVRPFLEAAMNKSSYTGNDLVSEYDSNKAPEDKGAKYTTGLARTIASITGIDAPVVDNFIQNWGGGLAKDLSKVMTDNPDNKSDGGGIGAMFENGFNRRFLSGTVESQYEIAEGLAKNYKNDVKNSEAFKNLTSEEQQKVLNAIDSDMNSIASLSAKVEQGRATEDNKLTARQTEIVTNGFNADSYINAITDKKVTYSGNGNGEAGKTLTGNILDYGRTGIRSNSIEANDSISSESKSILDKYNSMSSDEWDEYLYGTSAESAAAEYQLALAKYENDVANGKLTEPQKIKREKELAKLAVSQKWMKVYRDAYSLAGTKDDMQTFLNKLDDETRAQTVATLNGLNNAMYEAGIITASTYKTRANAINNTTSSKSSGRRKSSSSKSKDGMTSAEASALSSLAKTLASADDDIKVKTTSAPTTNRKMNRRKSGGNKSGLATYSPSLAKTVTVSSGAKRSIA